MTDVLLINPPMWSPSAQSDFSAICPPLGLGYLAASLLAEKLSVKILDLNLSQNIFSDLQDALQGNQVRMVGLTGSTQNIFLAFQVVRQVKEIRPDIFVVMGGPHVSYKWEEALQESCVDAVVRFEGEATIVELFQELQNKSLDLSKIKGLAYRNNGKTICTQTRKHLENLDSLPYPSRHLLSMASYQRPGTIITSRGCPMKCIFCIASKFEGNYRTRSAENVVDEIEIMRRSWGIREFFLVDNVFTVDKDRVDIICERIIEKQLNIAFNCVSRADLVTPEIVEKLKAAGCHRIEIGVESGVQANINAYEKKITLDQVLNAADIVIGAGLRPMFTFQIGSPQDTQESILETQNLAARLRAKGGFTFFSVMTPYPGTNLAERQQEYGISIETKDWRQYRTSNPVFCTQNANRNDFRKALYLESLRQSYPAFSTYYWS